MRDHSSFQTISETFSFISPRQWTPHKTTTTTKTKPSFKTAFVCSSVLNSRNIVGILHYGTFCADRAGLTYSKHRTLVAVTPVKPDAKWTFNPARYDSVHISCSFSLNQKHKIVAESKTPTSTSVCACRKELLQHQRPGNASTQREAFTPAVLFRFFETCPFMTKSRWGRQ